MFGAAAYSSPCLRPPFPPHAGLLLVMAVASHASLPPYLFHLPSGPCRTWRAFVGEEASRADHLLDSRVGTLVRAHDRHMCERVCAGCWVWFVWCGVDGERVGVPRRLPDCPTWHPLQLGIHSHVKVPQGRQGLSHTAVRRSVLARTSG
eukprot:364464-Chlamydomonas_euryale.AAC.2